MIAEIIKLLSEETGVSERELSPLLGRTKDLKFGDYAFPCFFLSKQNGIAPHECAVALVRSIEKRLPSSVAKVEAVGPYLNFFLARKVLSKQIVDQVLINKLSIGRKTNSDKTIVIDYSSPNIAKIFHVGHLRTTLIGLSLDRLFRHRGYRVETVNHLGDWGTQFGFVYAGYIIWSLEGEATIDDLVELYVRASTLRKQQEDNVVLPQDKNKPLVNEMARDYFRRLEAGDKEAVKFWKWCLDLSIEYFKKIYARLGIFFDHYTGESFYNTMLPDVEKTLRASGVLEDSNGALGVDLGSELGFARVFSEDGRSLYITRDIAAALYRYDTFKPFKILYVVGAQQTLHFRQLVGIMSKFSPEIAKIIVHVAFGFVPGMKTRGGGAISLSDYLEEAKARALSAYREEVQKRPEGVNEEEVAEAVAVGATYFYFLSHGNLKDFQFKWEEALSFQGDSGPYLQYALARINSIEVKARANKIFVPKTLNTEIFADDESWALISQISRFDEVLEKVEIEYDPSSLALYCLELAKAFSKVYRTMRVVGEEESVAENRLALFIATKFVLQTGLYLLGVPAVERM